MSVVDGVDFPVMKTYIDCIPCLVKQALSAVRLATVDEIVQERGLREILSKISELDLASSPPAMGGEMHRLIRSLTGKDDPYQELKQEYNRFALSSYPRLKELVRTSDQPLETAARLAIAGNIIDFGANLDIDQVMVDQTIQQSLTEPLFGDMAAFSQAVSGAGNILYLADNTGEIVFDRLLIEAIGPEKVILAVRGGPVINDATMADARFCGLTDIVRVIDNGTDIPGTILPACSRSLVRAFEAADLIIAKGQGNYETLSDNVDGHDIFFLFKTKCPVAARDIGCQVGRCVVARKTPEGVSARERRRSQR